MCACTSQIGYSWICKPQTLPATFVHFLNHHGGKELWFYRAARVRPPTRTQPLKEPAHFCPTEALHRELGATLIASGDVRPGAFRTQLARRPTRTTRITERHRCAPCPATCNLIASSKYKMPVIKLCPDLQSMSTRLPLIRVSGPMRTRHAHTPLQNSFRAHICAHSLCTSLSTSCQPSWCTGAALISG